MLVQENTATSIPPEKRALVPYGTTECRICNLPLEDLKQVHRLRFEEGYSYKQIRTYLKKNYQIANNYKYLTDHFLRHAPPDVSNVPEVRKAAKLMRVDPAVSEVLSGCNQFGSPNSVRIEKAYDKMLNVTNNFVERVTQVCTKIDDKMRDMSADDCIKDKSYLDLLTMSHGMAKMAREQLKDISALRAPRVLIIQLLAEMMDKALMEANDAVAKLFTTLQYELTKSGKVDIVDIFSKAAMEYKKQVIGIRTETLTKAHQAVSELDKIY